MKQNRNILSHDRLISLHKCIEENAEELKKHNSWKTATDFLAARLDFPITPNNVEQAANRVGIKLRPGAVFPRPAGHWATKEDIEKVQTQLAEIRALLSK